VATKIELNCRYDMDTCTNISIFYTILLKVGSNSHKQSVRFTQRQCSGYCGGSPTTVQA